MKRLVLTAVLAALAAPAAATAQTWPTEAGSPADLAADDRLQRERLRALADEREAAARADQLRAEATRYGLERDRAPVLAPPPGPAVETRPLPAALSAQAAATVQPWSQRPENPADLAARDRLQRERLRALADERQAAARADQLRTETTRYSLERDRVPALAPPPGPLVQAPPLDGLVERQEALRDDAAARRQDTERRLGEMDAWLAGE